MRFYIDGQLSSVLIDRFVKGPEFDVFAIQEFDFDDLDYHVLTVEGSKFIHSPIFNDNL